MGEIIPSLIKTILQYNVCVMNVARNFFWPLKDILINIDLTLVLQLIYLDGNEINGSVNFASQKVSYTEK